MEYLYLVEGIETRAGCASAWWPTWAEQMCWLRTLPSCSPAALDTYQAVAAYKDLQTVERGFRCLKDVLAVRPIYHRTEPRVRGHLFVAHLALLLGIALEKALRRVGLALSLETALEALRPVRLVTLELDGHQTQVVTKPQPPTQAVLKAVGLPRLTPPEPCSETA